MGYCNWDGASEVTRRYHDEEWGIPLHDDRKQFEFLMMEVMQCGLNWNLVMQKRDIFRRCLHGFDYDVIADYGDADIQRVLETEGMIRSPRKLHAIVSNARHFQAIRTEFGSFCTYLWDFAGGKTILYDRHEDGWIPVSNGLSRRLSDDLRKRGFKYLGPITVYSHLQACGIINDHGKTCPRRQAINAAVPTVMRPADEEVGVQYFGDDEEYTVVCNGCENECHVIVAMRNGNPVCLGGNNCPTGESFALSRCSP